jgi:hypothetical protein
VTYVDVRLKPNGEVNYAALDSDVPEPNLDDDVQYNFDAWVIEGLVSKYSILTMTSGTAVGKMSQGTRKFALQRVMRLVIQSRENEAGLVRAGTRALAAVYLHCKDRTCVVVQYPARLNGISVQFSSSRPCLSAFMLPVGTMSACPFPQTHARHRPPS